MLTRHENLLSLSWQQIQGERSSNSRKLVLNKTMKYADKLMPYVPIPNVKSFKIAKLHEYHPILFQGGVVKE